ncbi:MAG: DUF268 domain-containing protein [Solirubrobacteraceae bacterium]
MPIANRIAKTLTWPLRRVLDPRFHDVTHRVALTQQQVGAVHSTVEQVTRHVEQVATHVDETVSTSTAAQVEAMTFLGEGLRRTTDQIVTEVRELRDDLTQRAYVARLDKLSDNGRLEDLDGAAAALVNHALSHVGFAAQAELWMNPPLVVEHSQGAVRLASVNERAVEIPFTMRALGRVPLGSKILDFGSSESPIALELASMGYEVTALDVRRYPFAHPNLVSVATRLEDWDTPEPQSFDAVLSVSTVEHVGLGWYGEELGGADADLRAIERLGELLVPGGLLVLTAPYGTASVGSKQRRYDRAGIDALLAGFEILEHHVVEQVDDVTWVRVDESSGCAVALVVARTPGS